MSTYATDGKCHNANRGTYGHECGREPAAWIGTNSKGWRSGFCARCREQGDERHNFVAWEPVRRPADLTAQIQE